MIITFIHRYQKDGIDRKEEIKCRTNNIVHSENKRFITGLGIWVDEKDIISYS